MEGESTGSWGYRLSAKGSTMFWGPWSGQVNTILTPSPSRAVGSGSQSPPHVEQVR